MGVPMKAGCLSEQATFAAFVHDEESAAKNLAAAAALDEYAGRPGLATGGAASNRARAAALRREVEEWAAKQSLLTPLAVVLTARAAIGGHRGGPAYGGSADAAGQSGPAPDGAQETAARVGSGLFIGTSGGSPRPVGLPSSRLSR